MDTKEFEEITQIRKLLERIAASEATGQSKSLFEAARSYYQTGNFALSVSALEAVREIADPFLYG